MKQSKKNFIKESESLKTILDKGEVLTNPIDVASNFNNFVRSVAPNIQSNIKKTIKAFYHYLTNPCEESFLISPCTKTEIQEVISNFYNDKATEINRIPLLILKLAKERIAEHLCNIYNLSFTANIFPDSLKIAKVTSVYKKCSKREFSNYKPISLLPNLHKITEKLMHKRLTAFLDDQKIPYKKQFGIQKSFSTLHAIISLINSIEKAMDCLWNFY